MSGGTPGGDTDPWITLHSGQVFHLNDPEHSPIEIEDIAHALSLLCRFAGQGSEFYSVAQHSVGVSLRVPRPLHLAGLLHDAAEAFIVDLPRPVKNLPQMEGYRALERRIEAAIDARFMLEGRLQHPLVKAADRLIVRNEAQRLGLYRSETWGFPIPERAPEILWSPPQAKREFQRYYQHYLEERTLS